MCWEGGLSLALDVKRTSGEEQHADDHLQPEAKKSTEVEEEGCVYWVRRLKAVARSEKRSGQQWSPRLRESHDVLQVLLHVWPEVAFQGCLQHHTVCSAAKERCGTEAKKQR